MVANADQKHRLARVLQDVNHTLLAVLQEDGLAIREQVQAGVSSEHVAQAAIHVLLQKAQHAPQLLEREALAAQFRNDGHLQNFRWRVHAPVSLMTGRDHVLLIPPLQLSQGHLGNLRNFAAGVRSRRGGRFNATFLHGLEHGVALLGRKIATLRLYST